MSKSDIAKNSKKDNKIKEALTSLEAGEGKKKKKLKLSENVPDTPEEVSSAAEAAPTRPQETGERKNDAANDEGADDGKRKRKRNRTRKAKGSKDDAASTTASDVTGPEKAKVEGTVYVEGISYDAEEADVKLVFEAIGEVTGIRMPRWHDSGKPRGYAHVVFAEEGHVEEAVSKLDGQRFMGRYLKVALPKPVKSAAGGPSAPPPEGCRTVFVKNLPYDCDEASVRTLMEQHGEVRDVRLAMAVGVGGAQRLKGFGYVQFASEVGTRKAAAAAAAGKLSLSKLCLNSCT
jgi:nucleolin